MEPKYEYTKNNHFKWGFGDDWYNTPDPEKTYRIQLGYTTRPVMRFRDECIDVARKIVSKATKPIMVGLSGGSDSQMVCLSLMQINAPFKVVILKMKNNDGTIANSHDIKTAYAFCQKYNIEYIEIELALEEFYRNKGSEYAKKYGFTNIHTLVQCAVMDIVCKDYYYIMAGGDVVFSLYHSSLTPDLEHKKITNTSITAPVWWQAPQPIMQHMIEMGYEGTSKYFLYTPEIIASYLTDSAVTDFIRASDVIYQVYLGWFKGNWTMRWKCFHMLYKPLMTMREWPEMIPARKFTGFEQLQGEDYRSGEELLYKAIINNAAKDKISNQVVATPIPDLITYVTTPHTHALTATKTLKRVE